MKVASCRHALFLAVALAATALAGCADVRQEPASTVVSSQADAGASQDAGAQSSPTSVPF